MLVSVKVAVVGRAHVLRVPNSLSRHADNLAAICACVAQGGLAVEKAPVSILRDVMSPLTPCAKFL